MATLIVGPLDSSFACRSVLQYNATLGHILNHSQKPNAWFGMVDHPRFGKIRYIPGANPETLSYNASVVKKLLRS
jgi:hypothetical protein